MLRTLVFFSILTGCSFHPGDNTTGDDDTADASSPDAAIDAGPDAPRVVMLAQTSSTITMGDSIYCHQTQLIVDNHWFRAFTMPDYPLVTGTFHLQTVHFGAETSKAATAIVTIYDYTGQIGQATLEPSMMSPLASFAGPIPDSTTAQTITFAIAADIAPGSSFVVRLDGNDLQNGGGTVTNEFHAAFTDDAQTRPTYYASDACSIGMPVAQAGGALVLSVEGTY